MATVHFLTKGKGEKSKIYIRFTDGRETDFMRATKYEVHKKYWKSDKQRIGNFNDAENKDQINGYLHDLEKYVKERYLIDYKKGVFISSEWLRQVVFDFSNRKDKTDLNYFAQYGKYFLENLPLRVSPATGKMGVSKRTIEHYKNAINKVNAFNKTLLVGDVSLKFERDFIKYLTEVENLGLNTVGRTVKFVKTICKDAKRYGVATHNELDSIKGFSAKVDFIYLNEQEIGIIAEYDFSNSPFLDNARDWLIVGLHTGQRVGDFMSFTKETIKDEYLEFEQKKTGAKTIVPIHQRVKDVLNKYNGNFPRQISEQKFNEYIKEVCKKAEIKDIVEGGKLEKLKNGKFRKVHGKYPKHELVSSHICRRSFATNHYGKIPTPVIMSITNHTTEKMFLNYIGKTSKDHAEEMNKYWEQLIKNEEGQKPDFKVVKSQA
jgi:integrase